MLVNGLEVCVAEGCLNSKTLKFLISNIGKKKIAQEDMMLTKPMGVKFVFSRGQLSSTL